MNSGLEVPHTGACAHWTRWSKGTLHRKPPYNEERTYLCSLQLGLSWLLDVHSGRIQHAGFQRLMIHSEMSKKLHKISAYSDLFLHWQTANQYHQCNCVLAGFRACLLITLQASQTHLGAEDVPVLNNSRITQPLQSSSPVLQPVKSVSVFFFFFA